MNPHLRIGEKVTSGNYLVGSTEDPLNPRVIPLLGIIIDSQHILKIYFPF